MTDLHILGMARSGTTLARDMLLSVLRANSIDCLSMGEFFSLLRTYEYGDPLPLLLRDEHIPLQDQVHRHDEMMQRYHAKHELYARYEGRSRLVKHIFGYRYDSVLDALPEHTSFVCVIREDILDHVLSWLIPARSGLYNTNSERELAEVRASMRPFCADLSYVREWAAQHAMWVSTYRRLLALGRVTATLRYEHLEHDLRSAMRDIATAFGSDPRSWSHRMHDGGHVLKLWSKEDKLALVENHEEVRVILEESHDGLAIRG